MKYKLLIFDLDGTLADTSDGIIASHKYANLSMGHIVPNNDTLASLIGGPLLDTYQNKLGYSDADAKKAVAIYREYYKNHGIKSAKAYDGIWELLKALKSNGYVLAVATLKAEKFAYEILNELGILDYFDVIHGVDEQDTKTKSMLITLCINDLKVKNCEAILIGDSIHDANGAKEAQVDFIAATYGFGFKSAEDAKKTAPLYIIKSPLDLLNCFLQ